jgi:hypothetical protein
MRMLGAKNTRVLLRIFMIRKTLAVRGYSWTHDETVLLIEQQLDTAPKRNIDMFRRVCQDIKDRLPTFSRSAEDCRARIKRLKTQYFQIKRQNKKLGGKRKTFTYFERLDELLGSRPSVNPLRLNDGMLDNNDSCLCLCIILPNLHRRNLFALCLIFILKNPLLSRFLFISIDFWLLNRERNIRKNIKVCNRKCTFYRSSSIA